MRLVGSVNRKVTGQEVPITLSECDWSRRYDPVDFNDILEPFAGYAGPWRKWRRLTDADRAELDPADVEALNILTEHFGGHDAIVASDGSIRVTRPGKAGETGISLGFIGPGVCR